MTHEYNKALCDACQNGYVSVVKLLLENGADPTDENSKSIRMAAHYGHTDVVKMLLQDGRADPAAHDNEAIISTSVRGHIKVVEDLLQDGRVEPSQWAIDHAAEGIKEMLIGYKYRIDGKEYCKMKNDLKT